MKGHGGKKTNTVCGWVGKELIGVRSVEFSFMVHPSGNKTPHPFSPAGVTLHPSLSGGTLFGLTPCHIRQEQARARD